MIQALSEASGILEEIVNRLISECHPRRIYLFGSRVRGDARVDSDYDLLVEIEGQPGNARKDRNRMKTLCDIRGTEVRIDVRYPGQLERRKDDPGTIDWDVVREGRLLYSLPDLPPLSPEYPQRVREPKAEPPDSLEEWLQYARRDLYRARHEVNDYLEDWSNEVCFLSHQAAEKMLKALLVARNQRPERTHNLKALATRIRSLGVALENLDAECELLTAHAVEPRYPGGGRTRQEAREAVEAAERIAAAVRAHLP